MAPLTDKDKIEFLLCALRHSGKTTWSDVGKELNLKTRSVYKRFRNIVNATAKDSEGNAADAGLSEVATPKKMGATTSTPSTKGTSAKRLKKESGLSKDVGEGDEEEWEDTPVKGGRKRGHSVLKMEEYQEELDASDVRGVLGREEALDDDEYSSDAANVKAEIED